MKPTKQSIRHSTFDGTGKQSCTHAHCPFASVAGLSKGYGRCPYHWAVDHWGKTWADTALPRYEDAAFYRRAAQ